MAVYAHVNTVPNGSTGGIMMKEHSELLAAGEDSYAFWGRGCAAQGEREMRFATDIQVNADVLQTRLDGRAGFHSKGATRKLLARLDELKPDVVHLHNLHGYYVNVEMLFEWLAKSDCKVEWTLHDCWAFTGHCAYFTYVKCAQWNTHCAYSASCPQLDTYPKTFAGGKSCKWSFEQKKRIFNLLPADRMTLITPSHWLEELVKESFLAKYPVEVRHNTIDKTVFKPTPSDFRERYGIGDRFMILGVASPWTERKGLGDFLRLAEELDSERCAIVLVGLSDGQIKQVSKQLIALPRTEFREELAEAYTAADLFVNPSIEETFGMTVAEANACGTKAVVMDGSACVEAATSGMAEVAPVGFDGLKSTVVKLSGGSGDSCE